MHNEVGPKGPSFPPLSTTHSPFTIAPMTYNVAPNSNIEREELLYESCLKDHDLLATIITEYITRLSDADLTELDDFLANNFGDN